MQKQSIQPGIFQQMLDSAPNAATKGQAQYFTPLAWAEALSQPLPRLRPFILDLQCGSGQLLHGAAKRGSELLGCDIDASLQSTLSHPLSTAFIPADVTRLYELMRSLDFRADLLVLNPPWDLHWHRSGLNGLLQSDVPAVREAFAARDERLGRKQIDSTIATLCLALDRCTTAGEGLLIANEATLQRLIFAPGAPHAALANHLWAHVVIDGNITLAHSANATSVASSLRLDGGEGFRTGVLYFAPAHGGGPEHFQVHDLAEADSLGAELQRRRLRLRTGEEVREYTLRFTEETGDLWRALGEEWSRRQPPSSIHHHPVHNLWLNPHGTIGVNVSLFDQRSGRVTQQDAARLARLAGKRPMQLVVMREARRELLRAVARETPWTVQPELAAAVEQTLQDYENARAPLYPLSKIMRLGFLDEQDDILCERNLSHPLPADGRAAGGEGCFVAGRRYALRSNTVQVRRSGTKVNNVGGLDDVEWNGQELAFYITDNAGVERVFMDERLRDQNVKLNLLTTGGQEGNDVLLDFTLQQLVDHFNIPDVPDVARLNPEGYQRNLQLLDEIERLVNA